VSKKSQAIIFVGMPGSGKSSCVEYLKKKGFPVLYFGGIVLDEVKKRGLELNEDNEKSVREDLRAKEGKGVLALKIIAEAENLFTKGYRYVIIDGLYSWTEYKIFKEMLEERAIIIGVIAPRAVRHQRLANRAVRPFKEKDAEQRDYDEIEGVEKGGPIANADYYLANETNLDELEKDLDKLLSEIGVSIGQLI
jgi:dephospho-CoA kinase